MNREYLYILITCFVCLCVASLFISGASMMVHVVNVATFSLAFVVPGLVASRLSFPRQFVTWLIGGAIGLFLWDIGVSLVIVKYDFFSGWYYLYPLGLTTLICLQLAVKYISYRVVSYKRMEL